MNGLRSQAFDVAGVLGVLVMGFGVVWTLAGCVVDDGGELESTRGHRVVVRAEEGGGGGVARIDGPIARPAVGGRTINARVVAAVEPLGSVGFDGQELPLVSADGRRLATQVGEAPGWDALVGRRGGGPTLRTRIEVWDISSAPARRVNLREPLRGVMLGRSCDGQGFLVEEIMADGSRRIGKADWESGVVEWLVENGRVNAFGELLPGGGIAWCARDVGREAFELVVDGRRVASGDGEGTSFLYPMASGERDVLYVLALSAHGLEVQARSLGSGTVEGVKRGGLEAGSFVVARRRLSSSVESVVAYQAASPMRASVAGGGGVGESWGEGSGGPPGLLVFHPGAGRMVVFDPGRGQLVALADRSIAGVWAHDEGGWAVLLTTPQGLEHQRVVERDGLWEALPSARSLGDAYVARRTVDAGRPFVLIGPDPRAERRVRVMGLELLGE